MTNPATSDMLRGRIAAQRHMISQCQNEIRQLESTLKNREERAMSDTQAKPVYKAGDKVTFLLYSTDALNLNRGTNTSCYDNQIISHVPAPEPVVLWSNVYLDNISLSKENEFLADRYRFPNRIAKLRVTVTELPDGKHDVKVEVFNVEGE